MGHKPCENLEKFYNATHVDYSTFDYLHKKYDIKNMVDIGCGLGGMVEYATEKGLKSIGIDGDEKKDIYDRPEFIFHDYRKGGFKLDSIYDLGWCVEVLEHIEEECIDNIFNTFSFCKILCVTHALPGQPGRHHVNCRKPSYWLKIFDERGFEHDKRESFHIKTISSMKFPFMKKTGMLFFNRSYI